MKAVAVLQQGSAAQVVDLPVPVPGPGEVRVKLQAAGLNPLDGKLVSRSFSEVGAPFVPGVDGAGVVESVGESDGSLTVGDRVFGRLGSVGHGTFAEYVVTPENAVMAAVPEDLDPGVAAALPIAGLTAMGVLRELDLGPGATLLVLGATGGVGSFLVQLAARQGLDVIATARPEFTDKMIMLGATATVDHSSEQTLVQQLNLLGSTKLDGLADLVGDRELVETMSTMLRLGGSIVSTLIDMDAQSLALRQLTASHYRGKGTPEMLQELATLAESGELVVPIDRELELAQGPQALAESTSLHLHGKTIIRIGS